MIVHLTASRLSYNTIQRGVVYFLTVYSTASDSVGISLYYEASV